tara:strand:+ start:48038 stop:48568 length:531 start_codon:yes stop_codon:yes gene_type:complete
MRASKLLLLVLLCNIISCNENKPRKPLNTTNNSFFESSIERNIKIRLEEENIFEEIIKNSKIKYHYSNIGFWYSHINKTTKNKPSYGDKVIFSYEIYDIYGDIIYDKNFLQDVDYIIDKDDILPALREGIKVLGEGETAKFLFPSFLCYGYMGDFNKIGINQPLIIIINLLKHFED